LRDLNHEFDRAEWPPNFSSELRGRIDLDLDRRPVPYAERRRTCADSGIKVLGKPIDTARSTAIRSMAVPMRCST
jgi:hypothetical protein